ncbi:MAG: DUF2079 domain-containing protein [Nanoarchaeota archaeon]|nr:DUF2079 domain-containing protein [Nanoarchaeota archaeon]MBU1604404.1 DUF2079 domain-containing protein [Nanoarchaeota archaeon]MBU2442580.1 DUF2079 domain-containing protein [Nanoarchaeota archaeon]
MRNKLAETDKIVVPRWLLITIIIYIVVFTSGMYLRYSSFQNSGSDSVIHDVMINSLSGDFFYSKAYSLSFLGKHFSVVFALIFPIYYLFPTLLTMFLLKSFLLCIGAVFIYNLSERMLKYKHAKTFLTLTYLLSPLVHSLNFDDFFAVFIAIPLILAIMLFFEQKKWTIYFCFIVLLLLVEEQMPFVVIFLGIYIFIWKNKKIGTYTIILGIISLLLINTLFIPFFSGGDHRVYHFRYSYIGSDFSSSLYNIVTNPLKVVNESHLISKLDYVWFFLLAFLFIPLLSAFSLVTIPLFLLNLLSSNTDVLCVYFHYVGVIVSIFFVSTIYGLRNIEKRGKLSIAKKIVVLFFVLTLVLNIFFIVPLLNGPTSEGLSVMNKYCPKVVLTRFDSVFVKTKIKDYKLLNDFIRKTPKEAKFLSTIELFIYVKDRNVEIFFPEADAYDSDYLIINSNTQYYEFSALKDIINKIEKQNYDLVLRTATYSIYKKIV